MSAPVYPATLAESFVKALGSLSNVTRGDQAMIPGKDGKPGYSYRYADLGDLLTAVRPLLAAQGLAITQGCTNDGRSVAVTTTILHWAGETMTTDPLSLPGAGTPQAVGSAITYARRYQLMAVLGLASDDDDGQQAAATPWRDPPPDPRPEPEPALDNPDRLAAVNVFEAVRALDALRREEFDTWRKDKPAKITVPVLTDNPEWCAEVAVFLRELGAMP